MNFKDFMNTMTETNWKCDTLTDFPKCKKNVMSINDKLNALSPLCGKVGDELVECIRKLYSEDASVFDVLPILVATRKKDKKKVIKRNGEVAYIYDLMNSVDGVIEFVQDTGLCSMFEIFENIHVLVGYCCGVEGGLDVSARKNRVGDIMQNEVAQIFEDNNIKFESEVSSDKLEGLSILGVDRKRFDFVITTPSKTYLIEVNYYNSNGSKPNEVARAYTDISKKINGTEEYEFVWITDGPGWKSAKNKLEAAYKVIPRLYNLKSISDFIEDIQKKC